MDLMITKGSQEILFSEMGLLVQDVVDQSPSIAVNFRSVTGRNARINAGATFVEKTITVTGKVVAESLQEYERIKDGFYNWAIDTNPFYITKMLPVTDDLYLYEIPGETTGDLNLMEIEHEPHPYRWKVITDGTVGWSFLGHSQKGLLYDFSIQFVTVELPFGETIPESRTVSSSINYAGNVANSQLESPWAVRLTASTQQSGTFYVRIGEFNYSHETATPIESGDIFKIDGISTLHNGTNVTHKTNYGHFELVEGINLVTTNFVGLIEIDQYVEFYK